MIVVMVAVTVAVVAVQVLVVAVTVAVVAVEVVVVAVTVVVVAVEVVVVAVTVMVLAVSAVVVAVPVVVGRVVVGRVSSNSHHYYSCRVANSILLDGRRRESFSLRSRMMA